MVGAWTIHVTRMKRKTQKRTKMSPQEAKSSTPDSTPERGRNSLAALTAVTLVHPAFVVEVFCEITATDNTHIYNIWIRSSHRESIKLDMYKDTTKDNAFSATDSSDIDSVV